MVFWEGYVSDEVMGTFAPILVYWLYAGFFQFLPPLDNYRLHTRKEEDAKNSVPLSSVIKGVLLQQLVQAVVAHILFLELTDHVVEVNLQHDVLDGMFTFYDSTVNTLQIYQVASVTFDSLLLLVLGSYLITLFSFLVITTRGVDDLISLFRRPPTRKAKSVEKYSFSVTSYFISY